MTKSEMTMQDWMGALMNPSDDSVPAGVPRAPTSPLFFGKFVDHFFFLLRPIGWKPNPDQVGKYVAVSVPPGFVTDLASIPRVFWSLLPPDGNYAYAAIVHDYLYWTQERPKEEADQILKLTMQDFKINSATIFAIFEGVHLFGGWAWRNNAVLKARGEKRILKHWPIADGDTTSTWAEWKTRPGVFA
jgi:Protein of unknown function (DUF1353)